MFRKIVVIGPESTGKSTLCEQLSHHYHSLWCPEYAREYLSVHGAKYNYDDLLTIAKGQVASEEEYAQKINEQREETKQDSSDQADTNNPSFLFIDTDMYVMKVWCEFVFGKCHQFILDQVAKRRYDLYLLCNIDLPWTHDELREYPDLPTRQKLYEIYKGILAGQATPWVEVSGNSAQRLQIAIRAVNRLAE